MRPPRGARPTRPSAPTPSRPRASRPMSPTRSLMLTNRASPAGPARVEPDAVVGDGSDRRSARRSIVTLAECPRRRSWPCSGTPPDSRRRPLPLPPARTAPRRRPQPPPAARHGPQPTRTPRRGRGHEHPQVHTRARSSAAPETASRRSWPSCSSRTRAGPGSGGDLLRQPDRHCQRNQVAPGRRRADSGRAAALRGGRPCLSPASPRSLALTPCAGRAHLRCGTERSRTVDLCAHRRPADYRGRLLDSRGCPARASVVLVRRSVRSSPARTDDESVRRASRRRPRRMRSGERFCATRRPCLRAHACASCCVNPWSWSLNFGLDQAALVEGHGGQLVAVVRPWSTAMATRSTRATWPRSSRSSVTLRRGGRRPDTCSTARSRIS